MTGPSLDPTNKSGKVSKKSTVEGSPVYEIDAAISEGMSGGPTVDLGGKVIGVNSFGPVGEPQAFNFVAPADGLATMLVGKGVKATLGPADVSYRRGLDRYYAGHYTDAIKDFDQTLAMSPDYPGAARSQDKRSQPASAVRRRIGITKLEHVAVLDKWRSAGARRRRLDDLLGAQKPSAACRG